MKRTLLVAVLAALVAKTAIAQPGRADREDEGDGPEAQAALPTKLTDVIEVAVRLSPVLSRARLDRSIARDSAEYEDRRQAWNLSANAQASRYAVADRVEVPPFSVVAEDKLTGSVGLGRALPTGGEMKLELGLQSTDTEYDVYNNAQQGSGSAMQPAPQPGADIDHLRRNTASLRATFKQPLMRGLGQTVALAQEKKADYQASESTIRAQLAAEELVRDIVAAYWELAYASFTVDVRMQSLELAKKQEQLTHEQMRAGSIPSTQLNAVAYEIAMRKDKLLEAQLDLEKKSLELRQTAGLEIGRREVLLRPSDKFEIGQEDWNVDEVLATAHKTNRKLATVQLQKKAADVDLAVASDQMKPQFDLNLTGTLFGQADEQTSSLQALTSGEGFEVTVGVAVNFELSGAAKHGRDAALTKKKKLEVTRGEVERQIDTQVVTWVKQVMSARQRLALAEQAISVAGDNVRAERSLFLVNKTTNFQVMQRQTELVDALLRRGRAIVDYHLAVAQLQFLTGALLDEYRVNVRPGAGN